MTAFDAGIAAWDWILKYRPMLERPPCGNIYGDGIAWIQTEAVDSQWYRITDSDMNDGVLQRVTHDGSGRLTILRPGIYLATLDVVWESSRSNEHVEVGLDLNASGTPAPASHVHSHTKAADVEHATSSTSILDITAKDTTMDACIRDIDGNTPDLLVDDLHITVMRIGGNYS